MVTRGGPKKRFPQVRAFVPPWRSSTGSSLRKQLFIPQETSYLYTAFTPQTVCHQLCSVAIHDRLSVGQVPTLQGEIPQYLSPFPPQNNVCSSSVWKELSLYPFSMSIFHYINNKQPFQWKRTIIQRLVF